MACCTSCRDISSSAAKEKRPPSTAISVTDRGKRGTINDLPKGRNEKSPEKPSSEENETVEPRSGNDALGGEDNVTRGEIEEDRLLGQLRSSAVATAWVLSDRSLSLKIRLKPGGKAVFKPLLRHDFRALKEVAAFRVAKCLGLNNIPPSTLKKVPLPRIQRLVEISDVNVAAALNERAAQDSTGSLPGAVIAWIDGLDDQGIQSLGGNQAMFQLLSRSGRAANPILAHDAAQMVVFDYLVGNWDRFSGANFFLTPDQMGLVWLDHNNSFARLSEGQLERLERVLRKMEWFPADLMERIEKLVVSDIKECLAEEPGNEDYPLLDESELQRLLERRRTLLARLKSLAGRFGKANVLLARPRSLATDALVETRRKDLM